MSAFLSHRRQAGGRATAPAGAQGGVLQTDTGPPASSLALLRFPPSFGRGDKTEPHRDTLYIYPRVLDVRIDVVRLGGSVSVCCIVYLRLRAGTTRTPRKARVLPLSGVVVRNTCDVLLPIVFPVLVDPAHFRSARLPYSEIRIARGLAGEGSTVMGLERICGSIGHLIR